MVMNAGKYTGLVLLLAMLAGCATNPMYPDLREQAKPVTVTQVVTSPQNMPGTVVIWGGHITGVENGTNGGTLYVMQLPLAKNGKPFVYCGTSGGFVATDSAFIDPEAYSYGRLVTVAGEITGVRTETLDRITETCPVVAVRQIYLWPVVRRDYDHDCYYGTPGYYLGPVWWWFGAVYYPFGYYYYHHERFHEGYGAYGFEDYGGIPGRW